MPYVEIAYFILMLGAAIALGYGGAWLIRKLFKTATTLVSGMNQRP